MKLALLGCDSDALQLVRYLARVREHQLVRVFEADSFREELQRLVPAATWGEQWETLLAGAEVDAVILGREKRTGQRDDVRIDQLRKLVQGAVPLLLVHPACEAIVALELDMIRRDSHCPMAVYFPGCGHPVVTRLAELSRAGGDSQIGVVEQIVFERTMARRERQDVLTQLSRDADWLRQLLGETRRVNATGDAASLANLSVHISGPGDLAARWTVLPASGDAGGQIVLFGSTGRAVLNLSAAAWSLEINGEEVDSESPDDWCAERAALDSLAAAIAGQSPSPDWSDVCRDLDLVDAAERSAKRGRAIDLQNVVVTEADTFKSLMSAGSCLLLLLAAVCAFVFTVIEGVRMAGNSAAPGTVSPWRYWPVCLLTPLIIFLLLQCLQMVFKAPLRAENSASEPRKTSSEG